MIYSYNFHLFYSASQTDWILLGIIVILILLQCVGTEFSYICKVILLGMALFITFVLWPNHESFTLWASMDLVAWGFVALSTWMLTPFVMAIEAISNRTDIDGVMRNQKSSMIIIVVMTFLFFGLGGFVFEPGSLAAWSFIQWAAESLGSCLAMMVFDQSNFDVNCVMCIGIIGIILAMIFLPIIILAQVLAFSFAVFGGIMSFALSF
ncbi:MAG: hypothetical protein GF364_13355 [Candidatus Lokiarchaeota archaeon]|nr:hypothetical protein [Candidatus Lokiarchaeota archaeon]